MNILSIIVIIIIFIVLVIGYIFYTKKDNMEINAEMLDKYPVLQREALRKDKKLTKENDLWQIPGFGIILMKNNDFFCNEKKVTPQEYSYFSSDVAVGDWESVTVLDCESKYFIVEEDGSGPELYGPFENKF